MRIAAIEEYNESDLLILRIGSRDGFGEAYRAVSEAKSVANAHGFDPKFLALPRGIAVERHRDALAEWAAKCGLGIRCTMSGDVPEFVIGSTKLGVLSTSSNLTDALEQAYEAYNERD